MKKNIFEPALFALFIFAFICFIPQLSQATPPKSVDLAFDVSAQNLSVRIEHSTLAPGMHYIEYVEIKKNGKVLSNNKYDNQPTDGIFTYTYNIQAAKGDVFEVTATCSLWGHKTSTLTVP